MSIWLFVVLIVGVVWLGPKLKKALSADHRDDPIYKNSVRRLIERSRRFEESKE
jgi:hypothetical protein